MKKLGFKAKPNCPIWKFLGILPMLCAWASAAPTLGQALRSDQKVQSKLAIRLEGGLKKPYPAPEFVGIRDWLNSKPEKLRSLRGKVVLVDFWTYSCINCVRTLPHLTAWDKEYRSQGLVIVGVHTPEFKFEKNVSNIKKALDRDHIRYPVAVDSSSATWNAYKNEAWPAHYLIDQHGQVVYVHLGEGDHDVTENNIRALLGLSGPAASDSESTPYSDNETPETYLGAERSERKVSDAVSPLPLNHWTLEGKWKTENERIVSEAPGAILRLRFNARKVFLVMGSSTGKPVDVTLKLNGVAAVTKEGADAHGGFVSVTGHTLYELIDQGVAKPGLLEISAKDAGIEMYAFTFGS